LVLVLDAPGSVMYERKGEHSAEFLETQRQHFLALRQQIPQLEVVDATRAQNIVRSDVVERIWRQYLAHWIKQ
jgi:thymidylate kinase